MVIGNRNVRPRDADGPHRSEDGAWWPYRAVHGSAHVEGTLAADRPGAMGNPPAGRPLFCSTTIAVSGGRRMINLREH
jgi:hypothetical protein